MQDYPELSLIKFVHEKVGNGDPRTSTTLHQSPNDILLSSSIDSSRIPRRRRRRRYTQLATLEIHCTQPCRKLIPVAHGQVIDCRIRMVRAGWGWGSGSRAGRPAGEAGVPVGEILLKPFRRRTQSRLLMMVVVICVVTAVEGFSRGHWSGGIINPQIIHRWRDEALGSKMMLMLVLVLMLVVMVMVVMLGVEARGGNSCK